MVDNRAAARQTQIVGASVPPSAPAAQPQPPLPHKPTLRERAAADYTLHGRLHRRMLQALDIQTRWCPLAAAHPK